MVTTRSKQSNSATAPTNTDSSSNNKKKYKPRESLPDSLQKELATLIEKSGGIASFITTNDTGQRFHSLLSNNIQTYGSGDSALRKRVRDHVSVWKKWHKLKKYDKLVLQKFQVQSFAAQQKKSSTEYQRKDSWSSSSTSSDSDKDLDDDDDNNSNSNNLRGAPISNRLPITRKKTTVTTAKTEPIINISSIKVHTMSNLPPNTTGVSYNPNRPKCMPWCSEVFFVKDLVGVKKKSFYNGYAIMTKIDKWYVV